MPLYDDSREAWGAAKPSGTIRTVSWAEKTEILWHYVDGNPQRLDGKDHSACLKLVKAFQTFHMGPSRGWSDIGYNALVCPHGRLIEGRGILTVGAQCPNHNRQGIGVQFMYGGNEIPSAAAFARAVRFVAEATAQAGHSFRVMGHRDGTATACPGSVIYAWLLAGMPVALTPTAPPEEDDMFEQADSDRLARLEAAVKALAEHEAGRYNVATGRYQHHTSVLAGIAEKVGAPIDVDEDALAASLGPVLTAAVEAAAKSQGVADPAALAKAVVAELGATLTTKETS